VYCTVRLAGGANDWISAEETVDGPERWTPRGRTPVCLRPLVMGVSRVTLMRTQSFQSIWRLHSNEAALCNFNRNV
jgi:hypothetical protein